MVKTIIDAKSVHLRAPAVQCLTIDAGSDAQRLDNFLIKTLKGAPKSLVYRIIRSGEVRVNKARAQPETRLVLGDLVRVPPLRLETPNPHAPVVHGREFPVIYEDELIIAINKPAGVAVHGGSGVSSGVIEQLRKARPQERFLELVHRLDKETSGVLLIAKKRSALTALQHCFRQRTVHKIYSAMVSGQWPTSCKVIDATLHKYLNTEGERRVRVVDADHVAAQRSITLVTVVKQYQWAALLDVIIKTGRTHQIRVHLTHAGHPILGDSKYGDFSLNKALAAGNMVKGMKFERMFLHARELRIPHPRTAQELVILAPMPPQCEALTNSLT